MQLLRLKLRTIQANNIKPIQTKQHNKNAYQKTQTIIFKVRYKEKNNTNKQYNNYTNKQYNNNTNKTR